MCKLNHPPQRKDFHARRLFPKPAKPEPNTFDVGANLVALDGLSKRGQAPMLFTYGVGDDLASLRATSKRGQVRAYILLKRTVLGQVRAYRLLK